MKIGYVRVSKQEQHEALQIDALKEAGCEKWFLDKMTGSKAERKGWMKRWPICEQEIHWWYGSWIEQDAHSPISLSSSRASRSAVSSSSVSRSKLIPRRQEANSSSNKLMLVAKHRHSTSFLFRLQHPFPGVFFTK